MSIKPHRSEYRVIIDLTGDEQSCYFCRNTLTPGPKYRVYGCVCDGSVIDQASLTPIVTLRQMYFHRTLSEIP